MVDENIPSEKVTTFDRGQYERLMRAVDANDHSLSEQFLKASSDVRLDGTLGGRIKAGNETWPVIAEFNGAASKFGESVHRINKAFSDDWHGFVTSLNSAKDVFEDTDNLASYSAKSFVDENPGIQGSESGGEQKS